MGQRKVRRIFRAKGLPQLINAPTYNILMILETTIATVCKIAYIVIFLALGAFLTVGGYILNKDKDWRRVWEELGRPDVKDVKELKALIKRQGY